MLESESKVIFFISLSPELLTIKFKTLFGLQLICILNIKSHQAEQSAVKIVSINVPIVSRLKVNLM